MENKNKIEFLKYYEPVHDQLYKYCRAISGNTVDAEDLIQDTILNVLEGFDKIKDLSGHPSGLFIISINTNKGFRTYSIIVSHLFVCKLW